MRRKGASSEKERRRGGRVRGGVPIVMYYNTK